jgi:NAD(P)-dependent dehydrogenase (short-subunit alcohol dehydrogenase family)
MNAREVLITGSYGNLGRSIAEHFAREGAKLYLQGRSWTQQRKQWANTLDSAASVTLLSCDLGTPEEIEAMFTEISGYSTGLDVLVNNAGVQDISPLGQMPLEQWRHMLDVNLTAVHLLTQHFSSLTDPGQGGSIINILSIEAEHPAVGHSHYAAAKGGLLQYTRAAALELGEKQIRVNGVSPGLIYRERLESQWPEGLKRYRSASPLGRTVTSDEVAEAVIFLSHARSVTGITIPVDAGISAVTGY